MSFKKILLTSVGAMAFGIFLWSCGNEGVANLPDNQNGGKSQYYLGYGYDVINSSYINRSDVKVSHPILDQQKLIKAGMVASEQVSVQDFQVSVGSSISTFYKDRNAGLNIGYENNVAAALFSGKFGFEFSYKMNENRIDSSSFLRGRSYHYTHDDYIKNATAQNMLEYLTDNFAVDLKTKTAAQLLDQYGTHAVIRYYKGGALEFNYVYSGSVLKSASDLKTALNGSYAGISGDASYNASSKANELEEKSTFHYYTYGGSPLDAFTLQELKNTYSVWLSSIAANADICGVGNFDQSFISIWELAEANGDKSKAQAIENEFNTRAIKQGKALLVRRIKTETYEKNTSGSYTYTFSGAEKNSPAIIEVYVLGSGGGGQGGHQIKRLRDTYRGTGGAGGGGAAAYMNLVVEEPVTFNITVGKGGSGGTYADVGVGVESRSGNDGIQGEATSVKLSAMNITLSAEGGFGGAGNGLNTDGGAGGRSPTLPSSSLITESKSASGSPGNNGSKDDDVQSVGGSAAILKTGSVNPFGGGLGSIRQKGGGGGADYDGNIKPAEIGGGGSGGYGLRYGWGGGDGHVIIKVKYYSSEENDLYKKADMNK